MAHQGGCTFHGWGGIIPGGLTLVLAWLMTDGMASIKHISEIIDQLQQKGAWTFQGQTLFSALGYT